MAVKFHLPDGEATDIVSSRSSWFIAPHPRTSSSSPVRGSPIPRPTNPTWRSWARTSPSTRSSPRRSRRGYPPKIAPTISYVTSDCRALHAFGLVDADGGTRWGRYIWEPDEGVRYLTEEEQEAASRDYLQEEIRKRLAAGTATMHLDFALALEDDPLDDPTAEWEGDRELVRLGTLEVTEVIEDPDRIGRWCSIRCGSPTGSSPRRTRSSPRGRRRIRFRSSAGPAVDQSRKVSSKAGWRGAASRISSSEASASIPMNDFTSHAHLSM